MNSDCLHQALQRRPYGCSQGSDLVLSQGNVIRSAMSGNNVRRFFYASSTVPHLNPDNSGGVFFSFFFFFFVFCLGPVACNTASAEGDAL